MNRNPWTDTIDDTDVRVWYEPLPRIWYWSIGDEEEPIETGFALTRSQAIEDCLTVHTELDSAA